jgi:aspartate racemase
MNACVELPRLGVLGGMGPLATVDFMHKLIRATPGNSDQEHMPVVVYSVPQIPDRSQAFLRGSDEPWPYLLEGLRTLEQSGARAIAIPCNTAHAWHARLASTTNATVLHIGKAACDQIAATCNPGCRVGILATGATLAARIYHGDLEALGANVVEPDAAVQQQSVIAGIHAVKAGRVDLGAEHLLDAVRHLQTHAVDVLLLACTEIPVALAGLPLGLPAIDPTDALAHACVTWWQHARLPSFAAPSSVLSTNE